MEASTSLYIASVMGAVGVWLLLRRSSRPLQGLGAIAALATLGWLIATLVEVHGQGPEDRPGAFFVLFSAIALGAAVRLITSPRPVYCALYFVLVVVASAALFLLMEAEFMAFALVIVYAGAILITYLFVLMLAQQAPVEGQEYTQAEYDLVPREPAAAVAVGFIMLAVLGTMLVRGPEALPVARPTDQAAAEAWSDLAAMPRALEAVVRRTYPDIKWEPVQVEGHAPLTVIGEAAFVTGTEPGTSEVRQFALPPEAMPSNIERVGLALVRKFPVSLELAGVILLMAMFGAVVLARRQIELGEDEKRLASLRLEAVKTSPGGQGSRASSSRFAGPAT